MISGDIKQGAIEAAEAFILPSHQENFGIVVAEALACGKPVLISNKVNIWREIEQDGAGLVASDDLDGTRWLLRRWLEMPADEKQLMSARARESFLNRFEIRKSAQSVIDVLSPLIGGASTDHTESVLSSPIRRTLKTVHLRIEIPNKRTHRAIALRHIDIFTA